MRGIRSGSAFVLLAALLPACGGGGGSSGSGVTLGGGPVTPVVGSGAVPVGLPARLAIGLGDFELSWVTASGVPWDYRYTYLSGGVNTGAGWSTWNSPPGEYALLYMNASSGAGMVPVLTYYQIVNSSPNPGSQDPDPKLQNLSTMYAYFEDFKLLMQMCQQFGKTVIVHVEPDFWGFCQSAHGDDPSVIPVAVDASGYPDAAGFPNNLPGFAQTLVHLRDRYGPNAVLAFHASDWAAGDDLILNHADPVVQANRTGGFLNSLGAGFEMLFHDPTDRDAGYKQFVEGDGGASWWASADFARYQSYLARMYAVTGRRGILWQMPLGNTLMRTCDNTTGHYQDNRVEFFLKAGNGANLSNFAAAGVVAILYGATLDATTHYDDHQGDGITNGGASGTTSTVSDDDGGFFRSAAGAYYAGGPTPLP